LTASKKGRAILKTENRKKTGNEGRKKQEKKARRDGSRKQCKNELKNAMKKMKV